VDNPTALSSKPEANSLTIKGLAFNTTSQPTRPMRRDHLKITSANSNPSLSLLAFISLKTGMRREVRRLLNIPKPHLLYAL